MLCLVSNAPKTREDVTPLHSGQPQMEFLPPCKPQWLVMKKKHLVLGNQVLGHL